MTFSIFSACEASELSLEIMVDYSHLPLVILFDLIYHPVYCTQKYFETKCYIHLIDSRRADKRVGRSRE